jgi:hypothetical protein
LYVKDDMQYDNFNNARQNQWRCDKCNCTFSRYPALKEHKTQKHSY